MVETLASGITELPFSTFLIFMQPIHFAIAVVEGLITAVIINFIWSHRPELLEKSSNKVNKLSRKRIVPVFLVGALIVGGGVSLFASSNPDGLEWSIFNTAGKEEIVRDNEIQ